MQQKLMNICAIANLILLVILCITGFSKAEQPEVLQAKSLILQNEKGSCSIRISCENNEPTIVLQSEDSNSAINILGGTSPKIAIRKNEQVVFQAMEENGQAELALGSTEKQNNILLKTGNSTGIFLKNKENRVIGTWTILPQGGSGIGLANQEGFAAAILRGGENPSVSFFAPNNEPMAAMGMIQKVPHLLISGRVGNEGVLLHGGNPSSMLFVDEAGKVKILISKNGVFQGAQKARESQKNPPQKEKVFSLQEKELFFPETKKSKNAS